MISHAITLPDPRSTCTRPSDRPCSTRGSRCLSHHITACHQNASPTLDTRKSVPVTPRHSVPSERIANARDAEVGACHATSQRAIRTHRQRSRRGSQCPSQHVRNRHDTPSSRGGHCPVICDGRTDVFDVARGLTSDACGPHAVTTHNTDPSAARRQSSGGSRRGRGSARPVRRAMMAVCGER